MRTGRAGERQRAFFEELGEPPVAWIAERSVYAELAAGGLSVFDRRQKSYLALQEQWAPVLAAVG